MVSCPPSAGEGVLDFNSGKTRAGKPSTIAALAVALFFSMVLAIGGSITGMMRSDVDKGVGPEMAFDFGQALGGAVFSALFVWAILYFAFVRGRAPERGGRHLLIMIAASAVAALAPWVLAVTMWVAVERGPTPMMTTGPQGTMTVSHRSGRPPAGIEHIVRDYRARIERERAAAESARRDVLGVGLVQSFNLGRPDSLEELRSQLTSLRAATDQAYARQEALLAELEATVRREVRDPGAQRRALKWVATEQRFRRERLQAVQVRLEETYDETEAMIDLLAVNRGGWKIENGKVAFYDDAHLAEMKRHSERLAELAFEIDQMEGDFEREVTADAD